jgi:hypothetical protein
VNDGAEFASQLARYLVSQTPVQFFPEPIRDALSANRWMPPQTA